MKRLFIAILLFVSAHHCWAQLTISPVVQECGKKCSSQFTVINGSLTPLAVTVEAVSFVLHDGKQTMLPLAAQVDVSETSARIGPQQSHSFDFKVRCATTPCQVQFKVAATMGHTTDGVAVRGVLPEVIYLCDKVKDCRKQTLIAGGYKF